jgi:hypothetical protein
MFLQCAVTKASHIIGVAWITMFIYQAGEILVPYLRDAGSLILRRRLILDDADPGHPMLSVVSISVGDSPY